ncbi:hypothetical protein BH23ACT4_BH23ACT4_03630 [soil metagenome]
MSIDAASAIEIGKRYGLSLSDIRALRELASDEATAEVYAAEFGQPEPSQNEKAEAKLLKDLAAITSKRGDPDTPYTQPAQPSKRLKSGNNPNSGDGTDDPLQEKMLGLLGLPNPEEGFE